MESTFAFYEDFNFKLMYLNFYNHLTENNANKVNYKKIKKWINQKRKQVHNPFQTMTLEAKSVKVTIKNKIPSE